MGEFLGKGWSFPPKFDLNSQQVKMVEGKEDVHQSLHILLSTSIGERVMASDFGCDLNILMFEKITTTLKTYITHLLSNAIALYEPRIVIDSITIDDRQWADGILTVDLQYFLKATNSRHNLVYPFYLEEGTNVSLV